MAQENKTASFMTASISVDVDVSTVFRFHSADIIRAIAEMRIDEAVNELYAAYLISKAVYNDIYTASGNTGYQKATKVVQELQRCIENRSECFSQTCQVLLKLNDVKLKRIVEKMTGKIEKHQKAVDDSTHIVKDIDFEAVGHILYDKTDLIARGSDGTRVYRGCLASDRRKVAIKRILADSHQLTEKDKSLLLTCNQHENVARYFCIETTDDYHFLALEVCLANLREYVEGNTKELGHFHVEKKTVLQDALNGLHHLHTLKIIHGCIKPENILLTRKAVAYEEVKAVLCDYGIICKNNNGHHSLNVGEKKGKYGWTAPEVLEDNICTFSMDIFSMGCIMYYVLSHGKHPFGTSEPECHVNIISQTYQYTLEELTGVDRKTVEHLITMMIANDRDRRPSAVKVLDHCFFWSQEKQMTFLERSSKMMEETKIEENNADIFGPSGWLTHINTDLQFALQSNEFNGRSVKSLLRAIQYIKQHYVELPENIKFIIGASPNDILTYFVSRFPALLIHTYQKMEYEVSSQYAIDASMNVVEDTTSFEIVGSLMYNKHEVLGKGSDGTRVYLGCLKNDKRKIAVKKVLVDNDNYQLREAEKDILLKCDRHENIICYFSIETSNDHHFLALEYCEASLRDYVEGKREKLGHLHVDELTLLKDSLNGLHHLHRLNIIHRDIKPDNILLTRRASSSVEVKAVLCDFGISRQTKDGRRSVTIEGRKGTYGWTAPEVLKDEKRITCTSAVDIFAMGCVMYYVLSGGKHPFGSSELECHVNCKSEAYQYTLEELSGLERKTVEHLITLMIANDRNTRPNAKKVLNHCFFWSNEKKLAFLDISSKWIWENKDFRKIEMNAEDILGFSGCVDSDLHYVLQSVEYDGRSVGGLLRAIQYLQQHYTELPENIKAIVGIPPDDFLMSFMSCFPSLLIHTYNALESKGGEKTLKQFYTY